MNKIIMNKTSNIKNKTIFNTLISKDTFVTKIIAIFTGSWVIAGGANIYIPTVPIPTTMQTFAVLLVASTLGSRMGTLAIIAYIAQGLIGLPFFAGGGSGLASLASFGYILGFIPAAFIAGYFAERGYDKNFIKFLPFLALAHQVIFLFGVVWLGVALGSFTKGFMFGYVPFILIDIAKFIAVSATLATAWKFIGNK